MAEPDLAGLNPEQRRAVLHRGSPLLVLAGAGSGKTRVIASRIASLVAAGEDPASIVGLTFSNKAAGEMRERLPPAAGRGPFLGTFHAFGLGLLRRHAARVGLGNDFTLFDRADQEKLLGECLVELGAGDAFTPRRAASILSRARNNLRPVLGPPPAADLAALYRKKLRALGAADFDDLLVLPLEILRQHPEVKERVRPRHLLVDEFQDTNPAQAELIEALWPESGEVCVVGDEDQSIYGFRGASLQNLLEFERRHPDTVVVRLERNYRSAAPILAAAAALVAHNKKRLGKRLVAERAAGEPVVVWQAATAEAEAEWIAERARAMIVRFGAGEVAILYRTNAQSRLLEEALVRHGIAYRLVKGLRFYERREVKDIVSYLRLALNPADDGAFERIVNVPARGIGPALLGEVTAAAKAGGSGLLAAARAMVAEGTVAGRRLQPFVALIARIRALAEERPPGALVRAVVRESGYERLLARETGGGEGGGDGGERRAENIEELARKADADGHPPGLEALRDFLDQVSIASDPGEEGQGVLSLMTLHNAKGLEFRGVIIAGVEEGLLPHQGVGGEEGEALDVEEERRLLYVGMTRAKDALVLTAALGRPLWGEARQSRPSRFLDELPRDAVRREGEAAPAAAARSSTASPAALPGRPAAGRAVVARPYPQGPRPSPPPGPGTGSGPGPLLDPSPSDGFPVGGWVRHPSYGEGMITEREGGGDGLKLAVRFSTGVRKKFQAKYAGLKPLVRQRPR